MWGVCGVGGIAAAVAPPMLIPCHTGEDGLCDMLCDRLGDISAIEEKLLRCGVPFEKCVTELRSVSKLLTRFIADENRFSTFTLGGTLASAKGVTEAEAAAEEEEG